MWIPFKVSAEGMEHHDKAGSKIFGFINFEKHERDNTRNRMKKTVKEGTVFKEELSKIFINGEDTVPVLYIYELKRHRGSAFHIVFISTGRTKTTVTAERNEFKVPTIGTVVHGTTKSRIAAVDHLIDIFHLSRSGMKCIFNFFIVVSKDSL